MNTIKKYNASELPEIVRYEIKVARNRGKVGEEKTIGAWYVVVKTADDGQWHAVNEVLDAHDMKTRTFAFASYEKARDFAKKCQEKWGKKSDAKAKKSGPKMVKTADKVDVAAMSEADRQALMAKLMAA